MPPKILYIGGVKSGKSRLAERRALTLAEAEDPLRPPFYLATTDPADRSMQGRIQRHRQERGHTFVTIEEPRDLLNALKTIAQDYHLPAGQGVILIDCLTLWLSNCLLQTLAPDSLETYLDQTIAALLEAPHSLIFVINDVGSGIHADTELGRRFTDLSGLIAQQIAAGCTEVYHCIAGIGTRIK
jgi:adenosylcobinamide kinase/adenosylcobinamide-phosphate guanylyltransferase